jgi:DNA (cytosine-5)-methyltransferase 1
MGLECAWFAEIEPFPECSFSTYHFPEIPNLGDFTKIGTEHGAIDLLVGGTPCQDFLSRWTPSGSGWRSRQPHP